MGKDMFVAVAAAHRNAIQPPSQVLAATTESRPSPSGPSRARTRRMDQSLVMVYLKVVAPGVGMELQTVDTKRRMVIQ